MSDLQIVKKGECNMVENNEDITENTDIKERDPLCKFGIVPKCLGMEIECLELIETFNKKTGARYVRFIDNEGRLGVMPKDELAICFINFPTGADIDLFQKLKLQALAEESAEQEEKVDDTYFA